MNTARWYLPQNAMRYHCFNEGSPVSLCQLWDRTEISGSPVFESDVQSTPLCSRCHVIAHLAPDAMPVQSSVPFARIFESVSAYYHLNEDDLRAKDHFPERVKARQVIAFLARRHTSISFPAIGRMLGNRHHTTVLHGVKKITAHMKVKEELRKDVQCLEERICA